ncbi:MAG TPA: WcaF family extracellular polysaccharide biosynthesis acetyltransferase [Bryobacteraceae bacterium]|nr:WcaF family extracellular polysaccharide biosynthesis acetyltransferase [Bryobacteraceae bacterium]
MAETTIPGWCTSPVDLSVPDNSEYDKGRPWLTIVLWHFFGAPLLRTNWLPVSPVKAAILRMFGARIGRGVYLKPGIKVKFPWYLTVGDYCWLGEDVWIDNLAPVTIGSHVCVSQGAYLCTGNHDWSTTNMKLFRRPIALHDGSWVGARAVVGPGTVVGAGAVVTAGSVITKNVPAGEIWAGNPARYLRDRVVRARQSQVS